MSSDNTQLPAEVLKGIKNKALIHLKLCYTDGYVLERLEKEKMPIGWKIRLKDYEAGATEYAAKLHQAQQDTKQAKQLLFRLASLVNAGQSPDDIFLTEIQTFLDGK